MTSDTTTHGLCTGPIIAHAIRLRPGQDLTSSLVSAAKSAMQRASAPSPSACILTAVGSLSLVELRMANACANRDSDPNYTALSPLRIWTEPLEIVSLVGTFAQDGRMHLHISVSDQHGAVFGGHLVRGIVRTTCEVVLGTMQNVTFRRELDEETGYSELVVESSTP